jgi:photosynthetic reaction center H subunit
MRVRPPVIWTGNRLTPDGDPLLSAAGPSTYVMRSEEPFFDHKGEPQVQPLRAAREWSVARGDSDPRGMAVIDDAYEPVGSVTDLWVDRGVKLLRYLEVALAAADRTVLLPIYATEINGIRRQVRVKGLLARQFETVPALADPDTISMREEDQVNAYYAGGAFFNRDAGLTR